MSKKELNSILHDAFYEEIKRELALLPSGEELNRMFSVTKEKRDKFIKQVYKKKKRFIEYTFSELLLLYLFSQPLPSVL